jgi:hypothetical protein
MQHNFVISLPRSGSTVLTRMLSSREDVMCLPETCFPHLLDHLTNAEWEDRRWVAALYLASCSDGSPLTLEEAILCISPSHEMSLRNIALKVAAKSGRNPKNIRAVVWKSTRLVGSSKSIAGIGGRYLILHRPRLNVYESQFRVPFGKLNHAPSRFALFAASYDAAFRRYPRQVTMEIEYAHIPEQLDAIFSWIGSESPQVDNSSGALQTTAGRRAWHSQIVKPFHNDDVKKISNLSSSQIHIFNTTSTALRMVPLIGTLARRQADRRTAQAMKTMARSILKASDRTP